MNDIFRAKLRKIGSSIGILVPQEQLIALKANIGDEIEVALLKHRDPKEIDQGFGMAKDFTEPFERDKKTRNF